MALLACGERTGPASGDRMAARTLAHMLHPALSDSKGFSVWCTWAMPAVSAVVQNARMYVWHEVSNRYRNGLL